MSEIIEHSSQPEPPFVCTGPLPTPSAERRDIRLGLGGELTYLEHRPDAAEFWAHLYRACAGSGFAPPLDAAGNSVKGQLVAKVLSQQLGMDLFVSKPQVWTITPNLF